MDIADSLEESAWEFVEDAETLLARYTNRNGSERKVDKALRYIASVSPSSPGGQAALGGASGCVAGFLFTKIGKTAAFTIGCGLLSLQVAHYMGYVRVDWAKIHKDLGHRGTEFIRRSRVAGRHKKSVVDFIKRNVPLSGGFAGGFLLGLAFS
ncbi:FUN14 domain-containing protein 1-like [Watersipora subatra]|uniref:FUN14 domain-containing protein 1-like n=1 Tax=Watersipora subatra TaxID=2589382 RepID=UPI00355B3AAC